MDHPREYGENKISSLRRDSTNGSSPRIRGEWVVSPPGAAYPRIIPANTGRITNVLDTQTGIWDHPREYGENSRLNFPPSGFRGSSPRIRGEWIPALAKTANAGIIPANTGRIRRHADTPTQRRGSSPRIRGESWNGPRSRGRGGIIPANTGRMPSPVTPAKFSTDHPREYGENQCWVA